MRKRALLVLATATVLFGMLSTPPIVRADGNPGTDCKAGTMCKP